MFGMFPWNALWPSPAPDNLTQSILPGWSFLTVNEANSSAPDTERRIIAKDSYGRQLGKLMDAVGVLIEEAEKASPELKNTPEIKALSTLKARIDTAKTEARAERQSHLIEDLLALKHSDNTAFQAVIKAITLQEIKEI